MNRTAFHHTLRNIIFGSIFKLDYLMLWNAVHTSAFFLPLSHCTMWGRLWKTVLTFGAMSAAFCICLMGTLMRHSLLLLHVNDGRSDPWPHSACPPCSACLMMRHLPRFSRSAQPPSGSPPIMAHWPQGKWPIVECRRSNGKQRSTEKAINHLKVNRLIEFFVTTLKEAQH